MDLNYLNTVFDAGVISSVAFLRSFSRWQYLHTTHMKAAFCKSHSGTSRASSAVAFPQALYASDKCKTFITLSNLI